MEEIDNSIKECVSVVPLVLSIKYQILWSDIMSTFKRSFHLISQLKMTPYIQNKKDIDRGVIFPAVRNRKMCFYCGGSRPFVYDGSFQHTEIHIITAFK